MLKPVLITDVFLNRFNSDYNQIIHQRLSLSKFLAGVSLNIHSLIHSNHTFHLYFCLLDTVDLQCFILYGNPCVYLMTNRSMRRTWRFPRRSSCLLLCGSALARTRLAGSLWSMLTIRAIFSTHSVYPLHTCSAFPAFQVSLWIDEKFTAINVIYWKY